MEAVIFTALKTDNYLKNMTAGGFPCHFNEEHAKIIAN